MGLDSTEVKPHRIDGLSASPGVAVGRAFVVDRRRIRTPKYHLEAEAVEGELLRLETALKLSEHQLDEIREQLKDEGQTGQEHLLILEAHRMMLRDEMLLSNLRTLISEEHVNAEWAIRRSVRKIKRVFDQLDHQYFRERRGDVDFVGDRLIRNLMGQVADVDAVPPPDAIIISHDLSPADTVMLGKGSILGIITDVGTVTSHSAIVARSLGIPSVVGAKGVSEQVGTGDLVILDGTHGCVVLSPTPVQLDSYRKARREFLAQGEALLADRDLPAQTPDGLRVHLYGNIEFSEEVALVQDCGGEGIGLFRTEFLYLGGRSLPTEEEHFEVYRKILEQLSPAPVTIRTFDLGGDKVPYSGQRREPNPAMGLRALRLCFHEPEILKVQMRALLRASVYGNLRIMFPMVSGVSELRAAKAVLQAMREELDAEGVAMADPGAIQIGTMIELPSAVAVADLLAAECDFFSIGTNDLIQYALGIDRQNQAVAYLYKPMHLAVLRMIEQTAKAGAAEGIPVAVCGELAGEPLMTPVLLGLGVTRLSMTAGSIPLVKRVVREMRLEECKSIVEQARTLVTSDAIERFLLAEMRARFPTSLE